MIAINLRENSFKRVTFVVPIVCVTYVHKSPLNGARFQSKQTEYMLCESMQYKST